MILGLMPQQRRSLQSIYGNLRTPLACRFIPDQVARARIRPLIGRVIFANNDGYLLGLALHHLRIGQHGRHVR